MRGRLQFEQQAGLARVTIRHAQRFNAMSRLMWRELRAIFVRVQNSADIRCVVIQGADGNFCSGGDISEYADFRFQESSLRDFHEHDVWGGLKAMLDCDVPIVAQIEGACMGAGVEIACCCDIRLASVAARFGAPIARLGFPMAPREASLVARELGLGVARQMLLEARVFSADDMKAAGFLSRTMDNAELVAEGQATALRIAALAPQAAKLNKQIFRTMISTAGPGHRVQDAADWVGNSLDKTYAYADGAEHREGITAFLEKRKPIF